MIKICDNFPLDCKVCGRELQYIFLLGRKLRSMFGSEQGDVLLQTVPTARRTTLKAAVLVGGAQKGRREQLSHVDYRKAQFFSISAKKENIGWNAACKPCAYFTICIFLNFTCPFDCIRCITLSFTSLTYVQEHVSGRCHCSFPNHCFQLLEFHLSNTTLNSFRRQVLSCHLIFLFIFQEEGRSSFFHLGCYFVQGLYYAFLG